MDHPAGEWLPVPGWEGKYEVSSRGALWSIPRPHVHGGLLRPALRPNGYLYVCFYLDKRPVWRTVHSIVAEAFHGSCPEGMEVRHFPDPDKTNNDKANLLHGTPSHNCYDTVAQGNHRGATKEICDKHGTPLEMKPDGSQRFCRACSNESTGRYYRRNKEAAMQRQRERRARRKKGGDASGKPV